MAKDSSFSTAELDRCMDQLTEYEKLEVLTFMKTGVYYLGLSAKKEHGGCQNAEFFDDEHSYYKCNPGDHINYRYQILRVLGQGNQATVCEAIDHKTKRKVAIKIQRNKNRFRRINDKEIGILRTLNSSGWRGKNIVQMEDSFVFRNHPCIVTEYLGCDLKRALEITNVSGFDLKTVNKVAQSLLQALNTLHQINYIHADIKPDNVVFVDEERQNVKLIDFGSCIEMTEKVDENTMKLIPTQSLPLQTIPYRAPEVAFELLPYDTVIDIWSVGCLLVELYTGDVLFPATSTEELIRYMADTLGYPPKHMLKTDITKLFLTSQGKPKRQAPYAVYGPGFYGQKAEALFSKLPRNRKLDVILSNCNDKNFIDFIRNCLTWDPCVRISAEKALAHRWIMKNNTQSADETGCYPDCTILPSSHTVTQFVSNVLNTFFPHTDDPAS